MDAMDFLLDESDRKHAELWGVQVWRLLPLFMTNQAGGFLGGRRERVPRATLVRR